MPSPRTPSASRDASPATWSFPMRPLRISVRDNYYDPLVDLLVRDVFAGDLNGTMLPEVPVHVTMLGLSQGEASETTLADRVEINWCVSGPLENDACAPGGQLD